MSSVRSSPALLPSVIATHSASSVVFVAAAGWWVAPPEVLTDDAVERGDARDVDGSESEDGRRSGVGAVLTIFLGALAGSVIFGPISLKTGKMVPFGVFLALGAAVTFLLGDTLVDWYQGQFLAL